MFTKPQIHLASIFIKIFYRDRQSLFFSLLFPLIFTCIFLFSGGEPNPTKLGLVNQSGNELSLKFVELVKKEKSFLSEDFFNPKIEFEDPKNDIENPRLRFGENEQFLDPGKRYLNKLNRKPEKEKNPDLFKTDQYLGDFRNNGKFVQIAVRDHESPDGDLIRIMLNDVEIRCNWNAAQCILLLGNSVLKVLLLFFYLVHKI